jgi:arylsulfatase A-like enzyme
LPGALAAAGYRTHACGKLHLTPWVVRPDDEDPCRYPETLAGWRTGRTTRFPVPYYGLQTVDFVGGHVNYVYGPYLEWLRQQGGDPAMLTPGRALEPACDAPQCWRNAMPEELHYNRFIADSAIRLIADSARPGAAPFFAWCSFPDPHLPVAPPQPYADMYAADDVDLPARRDGELDDLPPVYRRVLQGELRPNGIDNRGVTDRQWRQLIAGTYGMITHVDREIGRVMAALARHGLAENTVVVFIADHGDMMGDHGLLWKAFYTFRGCIRIPLVVAAPGARPGQRSDALVCQYDLMPALLDLCGVAMPGVDWTSVRTPFERGAVIPLRPYPGVAWGPLLRGEVGTGHPAVVIENDDPTAGYQVRTVVTDRYRLSVYPGTPDGELFDLASDPDELRNLWYDASSRELRMDLTATLLDAYSRTTPWYPIPSWNA